MRGLLEVLLLDSIAHEPKHGYALIQELERVFGQPPNRNQIYPLLNRLEREGFLKADRTEGRGKTRYALTGKGLELLKDYRVRTGMFRDRVTNLWLPEGPSSPGSAAAPPAREDPEPWDEDIEDSLEEGEDAGEASDETWDEELPEDAPRPTTPEEPHLIDRLAPREDAPGGTPRASGGDRPPGRHPGRGHAGGPCTAEVALRRRPARDTVSVDFTRLDPACPVCGDLARTLRGLRDRWF